MPRFVGFSPDVASADASTTYSWHSDRHSSSSPDVLLLDAQYRQAVACMRQYGRQGLTVAGVACQSQAAAAPGFASRWCQMSAILPDLETDSESYLRDLLALIKRHPGSVLIPAHDGSIELVRAHRQCIAEFAYLALAPEEALAIAVSKERTMAVARDLGIAVPRSYHLDSLSELPAAVADIGLPAVMKPNASWATNQEKSKRLHSVHVTNMEQGVAIFEDLTSSGGEVMLQEWLPGMREAVSLFYAEGRVRARFVQRSYREWPSLGGASVLCEGIAPDPELVEPAERLVREIGLEGISMVEFRRDSKGTPVLMEVNPRMAGSVALAIASGVNFPQMVYTWAKGGVPETVDNYRIGRRLRWLGGDIWNLKETFSKKQHPDLVPPGRALKRFLADFVTHPQLPSRAVLSDLRPEWRGFYYTVVRYALNRERTQGRQQPSLGVPSVQRKES